MQRHTVANDLFFQDCYYSLKLKSLQTSESGANAQIEFNSGSDSIRLPLIEFDRLSSGTKNVPSASRIRNCSDSNG